MKDLKQSARPDFQSPSRSVSLRIRENQITLKVKTPVPQSRPQAGWPAR